MTTPRQIQIHESIVRPHLLLGADREMVLAVGTVSVILALALRTWWGAIFGVALWLFALAVLIRMAKSDPLLRQVYLRHVRYSKFYSAKSGLAAHSMRLPSHWDRSTP